LNQPKENFAANGIARHVDKRQKVGIVKVHGLESCLVQQGDAYIVDGPNHQPKTDKRKKNKFSNTIV
jgi:hypothetical protein